MIRLLICLMPTVLIACLCPAGTPQANFEDQGEWIGMISDPSYKVIPAGGCGSTTGRLVSETAGGRVYLCVDAEEREAPVLVDMDLDGAQRDENGAKEFEPGLVENVMRWTLRKEGGAPARGIATTVELGTDVTVDFKLRDFVQVGNGEVLVLGQRAWNGTGRHGENLSVFEYWVMDPPYGPGVSKSRWITDHRSSTSAIMDEVLLELGGVPVAQEPFESNASVLGFGSGASPVAFHNWSYSSFLRRDPVALEAFLPGGFVFVLSRDAQGKATTLHKLEPNKRWLETIVTSSRQHPMLAASVELDVIPIGDSTGYLLAAWGHGFTRMEGGEAKAQWVREVLCLEDRNGDGEFECEQVFRDHRAFHEYRFKLAAGQ
ncbi:MAG: hypothetical protein P1V35_14170 [Planctomycetota bacterium]|nr:hypothetical protein [Planctomycetota bacterium]